MLAVPSVPVTDDDPESVPPPLVFAQVTVTPLTPLPNLSLTFTTNGALRGCPTVSVCPVPPTTASTDGSPGVAVAGMLTLNPAALAAKLCGPTVPPRMRLDDACPCASVVALALPTLPPLGAANC